jgi:hypothetical protein
MSRRVFSSVVLVHTLTLASCDRATVIVEQPEAQKPEPSAAELEQEAVREAVRRYASALQARDAPAATAAVVRETFEYYEDLRLLASSATREQLDKLDLMGVMLILQIRARFGRSELLAVDGRVLFERAVEAGLVGDEVGEVPLDEVWVDDAREHAEIRIEGAPVVWLLEQDEQWRVDIPTMIIELGPTLESLARKRLLEDGKLRTAFELVELGSEEPVDIGVLDGPLE